MLVTLKEILADARQRHYAVPGFDCIEDVMVRTILETAEARRSPVILMCLLDEMAGNGWYYVSGLVRAVADVHKIPIVLHFDHATDLETIRKAIDCGFSSVMIDGSSLPFEENVRLTKATVEMARPHGVSVEAELGMVGGMDLDDSASTDSVLTEPDEVAEFCRQTGVDALAVSIGTAHGVYRSLPTLHIERLKKLNEVSPVPLVLHGGSGTPDDQIREAIRHGVCKLNIFADCRIGMYKGFCRAHEIIQRKDPLPEVLFGPIKEDLAAVVNEKIDLMGSCNRV